jgi:DNA-directed RNA polymerase specialized sigma24 family protein
VLGWARVIAGYEARRVLTKGSRRRGLLARRGRSPTCGTGLSALLFRGRMRAVLRRELQRLPPYQRRALEHELDGGEIDEFAAVEGVSLAAARAVRARARKLVAARVLRRLGEGTRPCRHPRVHELPLVIRAK